MTNEIEITIVKDGKPVKHKRPAAKFDELERYVDMQQELEKNMPKPKGETRLERQRELSNINFGEIKIKNYNIQIEFIVSLFKDHDPFTVEEFKEGVDAADYRDVFISVFKKISPDEFEEPKNEKK